jgi:O-antigen ligase
MLTISQRTVSEKFLISLLAIFPIGTMVVKGWMSGFLFATALISIALTIHIWRNRPAEVNINRWALAITLMLISPILAILISQAIRQDWIIRDYDGPSRFLLALPIFYVCWKKNFSLEKYWQYAIPTTLIVTLIALPFLPKTGWGNEPTRLATFFVDPLTFGRVCLTLGLLSLFTINLCQKDKWFSIVFKLIGAGVGFYLSIKSGSRTGWLAMPFVFFLFLWSYGPRNKVLSTIGALVISISAVGATYHFSPTVKERISLAVDEVSTYKMHEMNPDNSVGMRISFARMGWYYFNLQPLSGWGDKGFVNHLDDPEISQYASKFTRDFSYNALFHNEFTTNAVKSGIWGIISTALLFFVPLVLFINAWRKGLSPRLATFGVAYVVCELISGMSTEVFNLKFTASLYAVLIAGLLGSVLAKSSIKKII